jgi:hypothetical protein
VRLGGGEIGLQLEHVARELLGRGQRATQRAHRQLVGAGRPAEPEIDPAGVQPRQRPELLGDDQRRVVGQHDPPAPTRMRLDPAAICASTIEVAALAMPGML